MTASVTTRALVAVYLYEAGSIKEDDYRLGYYYLVSEIVVINFEFYVDLFLLWLLYRFIKPQNILKDGRTQASALLFAHDGKEARKMLLNWYIE